MFALGSTLAASLDWRSQCDMGAGITRRVPDAAALEREEGEGTPESAFRRGRKAKKTRLLLSLLSRCFHSGRVLLGGRRLV